MDLREYSIEDQMKLLLLTAFGCSMFIFLTIVSMGLYPGTTRLDNTTVGYSFTQNFFSDLGRYETYAGEGKIPGAILFTLAAAFAGFLLIPYFVLIYEYLQDTDKQKRWSKIGYRVAIPTAICYAAIGMISGDEDNYSIHVTMVGVAFFGSIIVLFCNLMAIRNKKSFPKPLKWGYIVLLVIIIGYIGANGIAILAISEENQLIVNVIGQKICIYAEMLWGIYQGLGSSYYLRNGKIKIFKQEEENFN